MRGFLARSGDRRTPVRRPCEDPAHARHGRALFNLAAFGTPLPGHCASLPRGVATVAASCLGGGVADLARDHTNLAYHLRWLTPREGRQLTSYVLDGCPREAWRRACGPLSVMSPARLLFCTECARADFAARGWASWRCQHQFEATKHEVWPAQQRRPAPSWTVRMQESRTNA